MFELKYIDPRFLHDYWDLIVNGLEAASIQDADEIWLEDIYTMLRSGTATLHIGYRGTEYVGHIILQQQLDPYSGTPRLHIWLAYSKDIKATKLGLEEIEQMARRLGANKITYTTSRQKGRRGYADFRVQDTTYSRELK